MTDSDSVAATAATGLRPAAGKERVPFAERAEQINAVPTYANWSVFALRQPLPAARAERQWIVADALKRLDEDGLTIRGWYDLSAFRADADLLVWWWSEDPLQLQRAVHRLRASDLGRHLAPVWAGMGVHRPAEFNRRHVPTFLVDPAPKAFLTVYPFVRSYDWYLLPPEERRQLLAEHGRTASEFPEVRANTLEAFAIGDYEWLLAFETDQLHRLVDLVRVMRSTRARQHVREETPFYTGTRVGLAEWADRVAG